MKYIYYFLILVIYFCDTAWCQDCFAENCERKMAFVFHENRRDNFIKNFQPLYYGSCSVVGRCESNRIFFVSHDTLILGEIIDPFTLDIFSKIKTDLTVTTTNIVLKNDKAFILDEQKGLFILDISTPNTYRRIGSLTLKELAPDYNDPGMCICIMDDIAYVGSFEYRLNIIDIKDLENPKYIKPYDISAPVTDLVIKDHLIYVTHFYGLSIFDISSPLSPVEISSCIPNTCDMFYKIELTDNHAYIKTSNLGLRIIDVTDPTRPEEIGHYEYRPVVSLAANGNRLYMACRENGIIALDVSMPSGIGLKGNSNFGGDARDIVIVDDYMYVADVREGLYVVSLDNLTAIECNTVADMHLNEYRLGHNYPNPFNPNTTIKYVVPRNSHVEIRIFNLLGREIRTLVAGVETAGRHQVMWDGLDNNSASVPSGVYFYEMTAAGFTETRKLLLIR
jgi:hypothetical protein